MRKRVRGALWVAGLGVAIWLLGTGKTVEAGIVIFGLSLTYGIVEVREWNPEKPQ